jgi:hypothetical protein
VLLGAVRVKPSTRKRTPYKIWSLASTDTFMRLLLRTLITSAAKNKIKMCSPSMRNREPIRAVLEKYISKEEPLNALEISSGDGTHVVHFAPAFPNVTWQPTEYDPALVDIVRRQGQVSPICLNSLSRILLFSSAAIRNFSPCLPIDYAGYS